MMSPDEAREVVSRALSFVHADHAEAVLAGGIEQSTRFANSAITQNIVKQQSSLSVRVAFGNRVGVASTTRYAEDDLRRTVERAEELARLAEPDTEYLPPPGPAQYPQTSCFVAQTVEATPEQRAEAIRAAISACESQGLRASGSFTTDGGFMAVANTNGLATYTSESFARFIITAIGEDSSGWAESCSRDVREISAEAAARKASEKALAAAHPRDVEPGAYPVILEPAAAGEMLSYMVYSLDAKAAHEGRSAFSGKEGQRIADDAVTVVSSPSDERCPAPPMFSDGMPVPDVTWISKGVLTNLACSRFWAQKTGRVFTGWPRNLILDGGRASLDDLIAGMERGILVTRFWYIRTVDPMKLLLTGMTRDGLFWVENGKIRHGLKNLRFNESPINMLAQVEGMATPSLTGEGVFALISPLLVKEFRFSSGTVF